MSDLQLTVKADDGSAFRRSLSRLMASELPDLRRVHIQLSVHGDRAASMEVSWPWSRLGSPSSTTCSISSMRRAASDPAGLRARPSGRDVRPGD